jgi:hypothetical protein
MTGKSPSNSTIFQHIRTDFASKGPITTIETNILSSNCDVRAKETLGGGQMNGRRGNNNLG